jgi:16S rRNA (guanine527-N7)-methyltransferase
LQQIYFMELIRKYFPQLSHKQLDQLNQLFPLYEEWNSKINVISRKDMDQFYERHVLHSMAIAQVETEFILHYLLAT